MELSNAVSLLQRLLETGRELESIDVKLSMHEGKNEEGIHFHLDNVTAYGLKLADIETINKHGSITELTVSFDDAFVIIKLVGSRIELHGVTIAEIAAMGIEVNRTIQTIVFY